MWSFYGDIGFKRVLAIDAVNYCLDIYILKSNHLCICIDKVIIIIIYIYIYIYISLLIFSLI